MRRRFALGLVFSGFLITALTMVRVAANLPAPVYRSATTPWLLPWCYFAEVVALAFVVVLAVLAERPRGFDAAWMALGALSTLTLLGAMTIGAFIGMSVLALAPAIVLGQPRGSARLSRHAFAFGLGLLMQAAGMFAIIQYMLR